jgi:predicted DNA-binding protein YlxM (UPF0122 family)
MKRIGRKYEKKLKMCDKKSEKKILYDNFEN